MLSSPNSSLEVGATLKERSLAASFKSSSFSREGVVEAGVVGFSADEDSWFSVVEESGSSEGALETTLRVRQNSWRVKP